MKALIEINIPEKEFPENSKQCALEPFDIKVALDYGNKVIYVKGDVIKE